MSLSTWSRVEEQRPYVLVTPVRDAAATIACTIDAMLAQAVKPARWVIVDDGSSDSTPQIVADQAAGVDWIRLIRRARGERDFAAKVRAFETGRAALDGVAYDFIGNLDADVTVAPDYFARVLQAFHDDPELGLAGGHVIEVVGARRRHQRISANSVAGAVQLFRRSTFDDIGGFRPMRLGGEDSAAEILARRHGWRVATLFELPVRHHGHIRAGNRGPMRAWFVRGQVYRTLGYDPLFQMAMGVYRAAAQPPYVLSGLAVLAGYAAAAVRRTPFALAPDEVAFLRAEQRRRLRNLSHRR